jgi:hypothetical protein
MSAIGATSGARAEAADGPGGRKHGRPYGSQNKVRDPAATPLVPRKRGRPPGSRNKKSLVALAAATAVAAANAAVPAAATSVAGLTGTPLEAVAALVGAAMAFRAAPPGLAAGNVGSSSRAAAGKAKTRPLRPPSRQRLSYIPKHGFATSVVPLLAGCEDHLPLPASFIGTMGKIPPTNIMVEDGSGGQPLYQVEVLHDEEGKSYLDAYTRFCSCRQCWASKCRGL